MKKSIKILIIVLIALVCAAAYDMYDTYNRLNFTKDDIVHSSFSETLDGIEHLVSISYPIPKQDAQRISSELVNSRRKAFSDYPSMEGSIHFYIHIGGTAEYSDKSISVSPEETILISSVDDEKVVVVSDKLKSRTKKYYVESPWLAKYLVENKK